MGVSRRELRCNMSAVTKGGAAVSQRGWTHLLCPPPPAGAQLLVHSGEDDNGNVVVLSAPRCTQLHVTEDLGICKPYKDGNMAPFSYHDRNNFSNVGMKTVQFDKGDTQ